ncbi:MAG: hypothetical protein K2M59_06880 [Muribaculaceae bacterium]|nr:hypothetical protein [Muribaculaceae bacterium]
MKTTKIKKTIPVQYEGEGNLSGVKLRRTATIISLFPVRPNAIHIVENALGEHFGTIRVVYRYSNCSQWFLAADEPFIHTSPIHPYSKYLEGSEWYLKPDYDEIRKEYFFEPRKYCWD